MNAESPSMLQLIALDIAEPHARPQSISLPLAS